MAIKYATKRIMDSVWTLAYVKKADGVQILAYSREISEGYEREKDWPRCHLIEDDWSDRGGKQRTVVAVELSPYTPFGSARPVGEEAQQLPVLNPQMVFSYGKEIPDLVQLAYALEGED